MGSSKISTIDLEEPVIAALNTIDTVADQITAVDSNVSSIKTTVEANGTAIDNVKSVVDGNKALLENGTYGLSAIKTAVNNLANSGGNDDLYRKDEYIKVNTVTNTVVADEVTANLVDFTTIASFTAQSNCTITFTGYMKKNDSSPDAYTAIYKNGTQIVINSRTTTYQYFEYTYTAVAGDVYELKVRIAANGKTLSYKDIKTICVSYDNTPTLSEDVFLINKVKKTILNSSNNYVNLDNLPRLDRCEFDWFVSGTGHEPLLYTMNGVDYVTSIPPYCVLRIKY